LHDPIDLPERREALDRRFPPFVTACLSACPALPLHTPRIKKAAPQLYFLFAVLFSNPRKRLRTITASIF
jgi:hypothetical protein